MSTALLEAPGQLFAAAGRARGRRPTLEEVLESKWRSANADGETECPVCQARMRPEGERARCGGCGTTLY
jgi:tRNA(Ile2) C34 agmatinyltransferase TiaS